MFKQIEKENQSATRKPETAAPVNAARLGLVERAGRSLFRRMLNNLPGQPIRLLDLTAGHHSLDTVSKEGPSDAVLTADEQTARGPAPSAVITVQDARFYRALLLHGEIGFGEAYTSGWWDSDNPYAVLDCMLQNHRHLPGFNSSAISHFFMNLLGRLNNLLTLLRRNSTRGSRRNISFHYDTSNDFFSLMLDETMAYSSGIFKSPDDSLHRSQLNKFERIAAKLQLQKGEHLLEIGSGWGGFAVYAAENYGCRVTTITLSNEQLGYTRDLVARRGLSHLVEVELRDYRHLEGRYDKIVSIEMAEALGYNYWQRYFDVIRDSLKEDGIAVLQVITFPDPWFANYRRRRDNWIEKHVFPGSCLLSIEGMIGAMTRGGQLAVHEIASIGQSYARTLELWRENLEENSARIFALGFDETFLRKWRYYLMYCQTGFANRYIDDVQIVLSRPMNRGLKDSV